MSTPPTNQKKIKYNPDTGIFTRGGVEIKPTYNAQGNGVLHWQVQVDGKSVEVIQMATRVAWMIHNQKELEDIYVIRCIDGDKTNFKYSNLEKIHRSAIPRTGLYRNNTSGFRGVVRYHGRWLGSIAYTRNGRHTRATICVGDDPAEVSRRVEEARPTYEKITEEWSRSVHNKRKRKLTTKIS